MYIYEQTNWPEFSWDQTGLSNQLAEARHMQGRLIGRMEGLGFSLQSEATLQTLTQDVIKTSEIEGEKLDNEQVRSSIARRLGMDIGGFTPVDRDVEGIVDIMLDAIGNRNSSLTKERLCSWHAALFPTGRSGMQRIIVGKWRDESSGPMQVISGPFGRERVHYEAPSYEILDREMKVFIKWMEASQNLDLVIKSAIAHFWFVTIHPFDDGNGRIGRALADMLLARSDGTSQRFYSMSSQIQRERKEYYNILERCQKGSLDITEWVEWYLNCLKHAITSSEKLLHSILAKAKFWERHKTKMLNERQMKIINLLLDGFDGNLTSSKWATITKSSQDTALRDINTLLEANILSKDEAGGRSTNYSLVI